MYDCDCDLQYSSAVQETPSKLTGLPQKSTIVCGGGRPGRIMIESSVINHLRPYKIIYMILQSSTNICIGSTYSMSTLLFRSYLRLGLQ